MTRRGSEFSFSSIDWNFWIAIDSKRLDLLSRMLILNLTSLSSF